MMSGGKILLATGLLLMLFVVVSLLIPSPWEGVDVVVVEGMAEQLGGSVGDPFINIEGDLELFMFAAAGAIGGFLAGYFWRDLFGREASARAKAEKGS